MRTSFSSFCDCAQQANETSNAAMIQTLLICAAHCFPRRQSYGRGRRRTHDCRRGKEWAAQMSKVWIIAALLVSFACWAQSQNDEKDVRIGVLGLFHSR